MGLPAAQEYMILFVLGPNDSESSLVLPQWILCSVCCCRVLM